MEDNYFVCYSDELDALSDDELYKLFELIIEEMNRRKEEKSKNNSFNSEEIKFDEKGFIEEVSKINEGAYDGR